MTHDSRQQREPTWGVGRDDATPVYEYPSAVAADVPPETSPDAHRPRPVAVVAVGISRDDSAGEELRIAHARILTVGGASTAVICVDDPSRPLICRIDIDPPSMTLVQLDLSADVWLNGGLLRGDAGPLSSGVIVEPLRHGDELRIADVVLRFELRPV